MINRAAPNALPGLVLTDDEVEIIDRIAAARAAAPHADRSLAHYLVQIAKLGGYLARAHDPPPGNTVMWRGWARPVDIKTDASLICG
jgi:hypothetical protein